MLLHGTLPPKATGSFGGQSVEDSTTIPTTYCLEEENRMSKEERKEAEQEKFDKIPKKVLRNGMVQRMVKRVHEIQDAEDAEQGLGC
jgi:hypothetical protein